MFFMYQKLQILVIKKLRILLTVVLSNLVAAVDIGLILIFSAIITDEFQSDNI